MSDAQQLRSLSNTVINRTYNRCRREVKNLSSSHTSSSGNVERNLIEVSITIIGHHNLNSWHRCTTNSSENAKASDNAITLHLIVKICISIIQRSLNSGAATMGLVTSKKTHPRRRSHDLGVQRVGRDADGQHLLDWDADTDATTRGRSRRRTRATTTVASTTQSSDDTVNSDDHSGVYTDKSSQAFE